MRLRLESLPPAMRAQAEAQLNGLRKAPSPVAHSEQSQCPQSVRKPAEQSSSVERDTRRKRVMAIREIASSAEYDSSAKRLSIVLSYSPDDIFTAQQKGIDFVHKIVYTKSHVRHSEQLFTAALSRHAKLAETLRSRLLRVSVVFFFPYPKSTPKSRILDMTYASGKADADNLFKGLGDSFTRAGIWDDDRQIVDLRLRKYRTLGKPRITVEIEPAEDENSLFSTENETSHEQEPLRTDAPRTTAAVSQPDSRSALNDGMQPM